MKDVIYNYTTLNINLCNIIDLYSIIRPRCYSKELLAKTKHILCILNKYDYKYKYRIRWNTFYNEWFCCYY